MSAWQRAEERFEGKYVQGEERDAVSKERKRKMQSEICKCSFLDSVPVKRLKKAGIFHLHFLFLYLSVNSVFSRSY